MTEEHILNLRRFRELLVTARRRVVQAVFDMREANHEPESSTAGVNQAAEFLTIQVQIDAVDRAIADEDQKLLKQGQI
jgi:hypothetical protein